jgi:hypothetical protein
VNFFAFSSVKITCRIVCFEKMINMQNSSLKADNRSIGQEIFLLLRNHKVYYAMKSEFLRRMNIKIMFFEI